MRQQCPPHPDTAVPGSEETVEFGKVADTISAMKLGKALQTYSAEERLIPRGSIEIVQRWKKRGALCSSFSLWRTEKETTMEATNGG